jgi:carboxylate-amine ligase
MAQLVFNPSPSHTIGVELEIQIISNKGLALAQKASEILSSVDPQFMLKIKPEFIQSMVEINTSICQNLKDVDRDLTESYKYLEEKAQALNTSLHCTSLHPFSPGSEQHLTDHPRYRRIMNELQLVGIRFITQGFHVHIGIDSGEKAIRATDNIRNFLPILLALTTSSPFYESLDTGLLSYRTKLFEALPLAGMPETLNSWQAYVALEDTLIRGSIIESFKDLWWDVRPHPDYGTVEVRVCDIPSSMKDILALTAMIQALVVILAEEDRRYPIPHIQILRANKWQAARHGLDGIFVDTIKNTKMSLKEAAQELYNFVEDMSRSLGSIDYLKGIKDIIQRKTSAHAQRKLYAQGMSFQDIIKITQEGFWQ